MYQCEVKIGKDIYRATVTSNERVTSIVKVTESSLDSNSTSKVFNRDGKTVCEDLNIRKRISSVAKKEIERKIKNLEKLL